MTETAAMITALPPADFAAGVRSCGPVLPHVSLQIGPDGAIRLASEALFRGYHPQWREAGDFVTPDRGSLDVSGHLHLLGRRDQVIITGGEKVDPAEVEAALRHSGEFSEVVVLGVPDPEWGERVVAAYPASARPNLAKVNAVLSQSLAPAKGPKKYIPLADWPVNAQGKVNRAEVARLIQAEH
jgi:O-succinylbenzoic acid--CoA ligase